MSFSEFKKYSKALNLLSDDIISNLCSIVFSKRENILSIGVITKDADTFKKILKGVTLPTDFLSGNFIKLGTDLESIDSDKIRIYKMFPKSYDVRIEGFYINKSGEVLEKKIYKNFSKHELHIDRYDASGNLVSENEVEKDCSEEDWTGPLEIVKEAKQNNYDINFLKKASKNQTYFVIHSKTFS